MRNNVEKDYTSAMFNDIRELCTLCAKSVVIISKRYNEDPRLISKLFIEVYTKINEELDKST